MTHYAPRSNWPTTIEPRPLAPDALELPPTQQIDITPFIADLLARRTVKD